jgi:hypothetical protein
LRFNAGVRRRTYQIENVVFIDWRPATRPNLGSGIALGSSQQLPGGPMSKRKLSALLRNAIRKHLFITRYEEQGIIESFLRKLAQHRLTIK